MTICDTCGKQCKDLNTLNDEYLVPEVAEVCNSCLKKLNTGLDKIRIAQNAIRRNMMKQFIINLKEQFKK
jgi:formylmethanofuran dehydrogenase subunit B